LNTFLGAFVEASNGVNAVVRQSGITSQKMADAVHEVRRFKLNPEKKDLSCFCDPTNNLTDIGGFVVPNSHNCKEIA
jgi:hypothetical protein